MISEFPFKYFILLIILVLWILVLEKHMILVSSKQRNCIFSYDLKWLLQENAKKSWLERNAESLELELDENDSEDERVNKHNQKRATSVQLKKLQQVSISHK